MQWNISDGTKEYGPFSSKQLREMALNGTITPQWNAKQTTSNEWVTCDRINGLLEGVLTIRPPTAAAALVAPVAFVAPVARVRTSVVHNRPAATNGLAICSIVVAVFGLVLFWLPFLGFAVSVAGLLIGGIAFVVAIFRGAGFVSSIVGCVIAGFAIYLTSSFWVKVVDTVKVAVADTSKVSDTAKAADTTVATMNEVSNAASESRSNYRPSSPASQYKDFFVASQPPRNIITMAKFTALKDGMSYSEVVGILGKPGEEMSRSSLGGTTTVMYMWKGNSFAGNMNAMFQDDEMVMKSQFGLK